MSKEQQEVETTREVRIHIDREAYMSPISTTGAVLYVLGKVAPHHELFRERDGDREDILVPNDDTKVHLKEDEHFYSHNDFTIVVNARKKTVTRKELSFAEIVRLAFDSPPSGPNIMFTITYRNGPHANPEGTMLEGKTVRVKDGMIFNVTATDKS